MAHTRAHQPETITHARHTPPPLNPPIDPRPVASVNMSTLLLDGADVSAEVIGALESAEIELSMENSSQLTLVLRDRYRKLLRSDLFKKKVKLEIVRDGTDNDVFALTKVSKDGHDLTLVFEDDIISRLRELNKNKTKRAFRGSATRAEFIQGLVKELKDDNVLFYSPELHKDQPIGKAPERTTSRQTDPSDAEPGFKPGARLTVKGEPADDQQRRFAAIILAVGVSLNAPPKALVAAMATAIVESTIRMMRGAGSDAISYGVFQDTYGGTGPPGRRSDLAANAKLFYLGEPGNPNAAFHDGVIKLAKQHPSWTIGQIAQATQRSAYPERYDQRAAEAERWVRAYNGSTNLPDGPITGATTTTREKPYAFERKKGEGNWAAMRRLAEEVKWRLFVSGRYVFFIAEEDLIKAAPLLRLNEETRGVIRIDFDFDIRKKAAEAQVDAFADHWAVPAGQTVEMDEEMGAAEGAWLVGSIQRSLFSEECAITLKRPSPSLPEPPAETETTTVPGAALDTGAGATGREGSVTGNINGLQADMMKLLKLVAGQAGFGINITSGCRPGDSGSNHARCAAADIGVDGDCQSSSGACKKGDQIATAALIVMGVDPATAAQRAKSGWCNFGNNLSWSGHSVEIGWRTHVGGNHYNHVHIGFDR